MNVCVRRGSAPGHHRGACLCEGEFGVDGLYVGVPCVIGAGGLERIIELDLNDEEQAAFDESVAHVQKLVDEIEI